MRSRPMTLVLSLTIFASLANAGTCPTADATLPATPLNYPMTSDRYAVQYSIGGGAWTNAQVYVSYYGGTNASGYRKDSGYTQLYVPPNGPPPPVVPKFETSMSFVSIPAYANTSVQIRVTKLFGAPFRPTDHLSIRPSVKFIGVDIVLDSVARIFTTTAGNFAGEQFILWWDRGTEGGGIESLAVFLNPPYVRPTGPNVKTVTAWSDLDGADLSAFDTLDFEEGPLPIALFGTGAKAYTVPDNIHSVFLGPGARVQGKLRFNPIVTKPPTFRTISGPGVLDVSRFNYLYRACADDDEGLYALTSTTTLGLDHFHIDGIVITDHNHAANHFLFNSTVNNVKTLGWNSENSALRLGDNTTVSNTFVRSGDDSLMMWGSPLNVTNVTVWQNFNGGVVSLGWSFNSTGEGCLLDGLYVVKTDWVLPKTTSWDALIPATGVQPLANQNNGVFVSLMTPTTSFGHQNPPTYKNIFVEDPPQVLFSLKIVPPMCSETGLICPSVNLKESSEVTLNIENLFSPVSQIGNSIGFQNIPAGYPNTPPVTSDFTLQGSMSIGLKNVFLRVAPFLWLPLTSADAVPLGKIGTNGAVNIKYSFGIP